MKRLALTLALVCALAVPVLAGDPQAPPAPQEPPPAGTTAATPDPVLDVLLSLLIESLT